MPLPKLLSLFAFMTPLAALSNPSDDLFDVLRQHDQTLFTKGFNECDTDVFEQMMTEDLEFYHDKVGSNKGRAAFIDTMKNGLCKNNDNEIARHLIENSLTVYPMSNNGKLYGAIQMGEHAFAPKGQAVQGAPAKFIHFWLLGEDGEWRISRVMSYDHQ